ncbi:MAG: universal stress protein [Rhodospirillaceae bacterium]|jgi:nucleotide-binding universal stress UspA family protein|nr:universal stress protein [Rhodospirillaceae bacterium]MBT3808517.1 universal stress protein [Rhodospirillaceae bacterium]MBT4771671.1 universal stress protein [Rhodospirillaceae bacterium]MBT5357853.1 universal stress protein [Rhodospirillaceae bacterium]MBT5768040.1 universal stress protein [Rhodospirillaceae bacterium]
MSYRSICVGLLRGDVRNEATLEAAIRLAAERDAHLTGMLLIPPLNIPVYAAIPLPDDIMADYYDDADKEADGLRAVFEDGCRSAGVTSNEWRGGAQNIVQSLQNISPVTDLFVLTQHSGGDYGWLIGEASLALGTPILAIPEAGNFESIGKTVLLAWTPRRECARAVRDAMPLLQDAGRVIVFRGNAGDDGRDVELGAHLARHGVKVEIKHVDTDEVSIGNAVLNAVTDESCDMVVMGAYGHSRIRELAFGGVTREVLEHMTVPTLLSH